MIVPMKKTAIIVQEKDTQAAVRSLRELGVVHVEHANPPTGADIASLKDDIAFASRALAILSGPEFAGKPISLPGRRVKDWKTAALHVIESWKRCDQLEEYSRSLRAAIKEWERWGQFNPDAVKDLNSKNIYVRLYEIPVKEFGLIPEGVVVKRIFTAAGIARCAVISRDLVNIPFKELPLPKMSLGAMRDRLAEDTKTMHAIKDNITRHLTYTETFIRIKKALEKELEFHEALHGMGKQGNLTYLVGYVPQDSVKVLANRAREERWGLAVMDPSEEDNVPTLLRNPRWVSVIEPVFRLMEIVPGYRELDISPIFLLFLTLFFGMIIGDAGYGALYIALTALIHRRLGPKLKDTRIFFLLYLFSASAIMWGILTGTVFGQEWHLKAGMQPLLPVLNDTKFLQALCFFIGAFHLTLGQLWQGLRKLPSLTAISDMGWISVLWAAFFVARNLILGYPMPAVTKWLIIAGVALVIFFTSPQKNILKTIGTGLGTLVLSIMNSFTDVVSYVRLFAVGLAGVAISDTVNSLAANLGGSSPILVAGILFIGHTINIMLGPISVMVHGVRLNVLEFSNHAGLSWSGTSYKPLKT